MTVFLRECFYYLSLPFMETLSTFQIKNYYNYVSNHINQTCLVNDLLKKWWLTYDDIRGNYISENDEYVEIYQWLVFKNFWQKDYELLVSAHNPILDSENETWVGITSFGSHYDIYVYPELINILFWVNITYEDIERMKTS